MLSVAAVHVWVLFKHASNPRLPLQKPEQWPFPIVTAVTLQKALLEVLLIEEQQPRAARSRLQLLAATRNKGQGKEKGGSDSASWLDWHSHAGSHALG